MRAVASPAIVGALDPLVTRAHPLHDVAMPMLAREVADAGSQLTSSAGAYFDQFAIADHAPHERASVAHALLDRDPTRLTSAEWSRLANLVEGDEAHLIDVPRHIPGSVPLADQARRIADWGYRHRSDVRRYFVRHAVMKLEPSDRAAEARALLARRPAEISHADWDRLAELVDADDTHLIDVPREIPGSDPFTKQAREIADGRYHPAHHMQVYFDSFAIAAMDPADRAAEAGALLARNPADLTRTEWRHLAGLVEADDAGLINVAREIPGSKPLVEQARAIADGSLARGEFVDVYFTRWQRDNDPAYVARVEAAIPNVIAGRASGDERRVVASQWEHIESIVAERPPAEQLAIAEVMLGAEDFPSANRLRYTLELLRRTFDRPSNGSPGLARVRAQTVELLDRNIDRLSGVTPDGALVGYSNHPDYAELGRIRENIALLHDGRLRAAVDAHADVVEPVGRSAHPSVAW